MHKENTRNSTQTVIQDQDVNRELFDEWRELCTAPRCILINRIWTNCFRGGVVSSVLVVQTRPFK